ncbi:MAG TPA: GNAT family N-acetyltransferase [Acidimicrobiales bacterium]|nr:GNAT family N-acetyltransferase [Acidimicrobiales bacterium]
MTADGDAGPGAPPEEAPAAPGRVERPDGPCPTEVKVELVLRSLRGEVLADLARETGRPRKQISTWRRRFLEGGEAALDGRADAAETEALRRARDELTEKVATLEAENRDLDRRLTLLQRAGAAGAPPHPFCSEAYGRAMEEPGARALHVPGWDTYVLVRDAAGGRRQAAGVRPLAPLAPGCDLQAGLDALRQEGVTSVSLITDPMWCPELPALQQAFPICRPFKENYFIDREKGAAHLRKRHRNIVNKARRTVEIRDVELADTLSRWLELYQLNVDNRQIAQPFSATYFERLAQVAGLRTIAVLADGEIVSMTMWIRHQDVLYYHDGASSETGFEVSASYTAFAHAIDDTPDCRYVFFGGSAHFRDDPLDGLAVFKRGFSNSSAHSYLCSATLNRSERAAPAPTA